MHLYISLSLWYTPDVYPSYAVLSDYNYVFSENGLLAHKNQELIGRQVTVTLYYIFFVTR